MAVWPSGEQHQLRYGDQLATVVEVGAGIRRYSAAGRDVLEPYPLQEICDGAHGAVLVPWPNRVGGGRYTWEGTERQLDLSEPQRGNAIHGLMRWRPWSVREREESMVVMGALLQPQPGYPFALDLQMTYELGEHGLSVRCTATNVGSRACPYGFGQHPYLFAGGVVDDCALELRAATQIVLDEISHLPAGKRPVRDTALDFNEARAIGGAVLDDPLSDLARDAEGRARAALACPDGARIELWADEHHHVVQLFTGDTLAPHRRRRALALEPMTCPPDALRSGEHLIRIEPDSSITTAWGVRLA